MHGRGRGDGADEKAQRSVAGRGDVLGSSRDAGEHTLLPGASKPQIILEPNRRGCPVPAIYNAESGARHEPERRN